MVADVGVVADVGAVADVVVPRSDNPARKRPVPWYSGDLMEAVFRWTDPVTGFIRFRSELTGNCQNRQPGTVTGFLRRIPGIFRRVPAGNGKFPDGFHRKFTEYCFRFHRPGSWSIIRCFVFFHLLFIYYGVLDGLLLVDGNHCVIPLEICTVHHWWMMLPVLLNENCWLILLSVLVVLLYRHASTQHFQA